MHILVISFILNTFTPAIQNSEPDLVLPEHEKITVLVLDKLP